MRVFFRDVRSGKRKAAIADLASIARKELEIAIDKRVKPALIKSHELVVADWNHKPDFKARKIFKPDRIEVFVFPAGENKKIWIWVDKGTKAHDLPAMPPPVTTFVFQAGGKYKSKTLAKPARTVAGGGIVTGGTTVFAKKIKKRRHPGTEGRQFTKTIAEDIRPDFKREIENAFRRTVKQTRR